MGRRQREWAHKRRAILIVLLGSKCIDCGEEDKDLLEFDCIIPQGHDHHIMERSHRMSFYRVQIAVDNLVLRCKPCHEAKSKKERAGQEPENVEEPF